MTDAKSESFFEPLGAMDRQFLVMEDANVHMHVSGFTIYETEPLRCESGGMDFALFRRAIESVLPRIPRYRQTLAFTPIEGHPVWVDAQEFDIDHHLRHLSLPPPGTEAQLKQMVGWIVSQPVDHARPLWEMWVVEGLDEGRHFAVVTKMHHCMIDGGAGANLMQLLLRTKPSTKIADDRALGAPPRPRAGGAGGLGGPAPHGRSPAYPGRTARAGRRRGQPARLPGRAGLRLRRAAAERAARVAHAGQRSPRPPPPHRLAPHAPRRSWRPCGAKLGCTLNDLVLSLVCGALRRYLERRGVDLEGLDLPRLHPGERAPREREGGDEQPHLHVDHSPAAGRARPSRTARGPSPSGPTSSSQLQPGHRHRDDDGRR